MASGRLGGGGGGDVYIYEQHEGVGYYVQVQKEKRIEKGVKRIILCTGRMLEVEWYTHPCPIQELLFIMNIELLPSIRSNHRHPLL
jgi:hypothetical protein